MRRRAHRRIRGGSSLLVIGGPLGGTTGAERVSGARALDLGSGHASPFGRG
ncbi:MAG TPA: hypothetical protein VLD17_01335 [Gemmatimonadaceae bacterium]|nr:hypothetical protein [Gemmatimonadaceae bacterium]